jgi:hypothetical protein
MKRAIVVCAGGSLLLGMLFLGPPAQGVSGVPPVEIWWQDWGVENEGITYKAVFTNICGTIEEWRYAPDHRLLVFLPKSKFPRPIGTGYVTWTYHAADYRAFLSVPGSRKVHTLNEVFTEGATYWLKVIQG